MNQQTLFPIARNSDPETSHVAAEDIKPSLGKLKRAMLDSAKLAIGPKTARELAEESRRRVDKNTDVESFRKRARELARDGLLVECGVRCCSVTGKPAQTFRSVK